MKAPFWPKRGSRDRFSYVTPKMDTFCLRTHSKVNHHHESSSSSWVSISVLEFQDKVPRYCFFTGSMNPKSNNRIYLSLQEQGIPLTLLWRKTKYEKATSCVGHCYYFQALWVLTEVFQLSELLWFFLAFAHLDKIRSQLKKNISALDPQGWTIIRIKQERKF